MKIYTTTGDEGFTTRLDGARLRKNDPQLHALGDIDSLSSSLGLCVYFTREHASPDGMEEMVLEIQRQLFQAGTVVSFAATALDDSAVKQLEREIDAFTETCPPLKNFIIPGGCRLACEFHHARCLCRQAERSLANLTEADETTPAILSVMKYLNRLSDWLFVAGRLANHINGINEPSAS